MTRSPTLTILALLLPLATACKEDTDGDGWLSKDDCDDEAAAIHPDAVEVCNGLDDDCDGTVDPPDAFGAPRWYPDADGDGFGAAGEGETACEAPEGLVSNPDDCDDTRAEVLPGATEVCDGLDNDCDGRTDGHDAADASTWYPDADGDGYGDASSPSQACSQPSLYGTDATDCDDAEASAHPGATEICDDAIDNDCDDEIDEDCGSPIGFATSVPFTEPLVVVSASPTWDDVPTPTDSICSMSPTADGYAGTCTPDASLLVESTSWYGSVTGNFVAFAFTDMDGDLAWDEGESLVAMPWYALVFVSGEPTETAAAIGLQAGWNALDLYSYDLVDTLVAADPLAVPLSRNFEAEGSIVLGGPVGIEPPATARLGVLFSTTDGDTIVDQGPVTDPWQVTMSGTPDPGWLREVIPGIQRGEGFVGAWDDTDGDGTLGRMERFVGVPRDAEGNMVDVIWTTPPSTDPSLAMRFLVTMGLVQFGWSAWNVNGYRPPTDALGLVLDAY